MDKKALSERDICSKFLTPAILGAGWDLHSQMREEYPLTAGRILVRGKLVSRAKPQRADYVLFRKPGIPVAVIEAKDNNHTVGDGMQQALRYAEMLDIPFAFSSNGDGFLLHDMTGSGPTERPLALNEFPSPDDLWSGYRTWKGLDPEVERVVEQDYYTDPSGKSPRYYQARAINRTVEAIAKGQDRALLVMATGTGKTYTAFQIIWRLWKAGVKKRILFLADRNILVDQTKTNDFKPFGQALTKIQRRTIDKSYEIYLSLYQAVTGNEDERNVYKEFSRDFFDLVVIDECHRGSAVEASQWREILDYFDRATHLGMTATPKETKDVSNITYFGEPVDTYSLRQGIEDGFLAPYKVVRIDIDKDLQGWRPEKGKRDDLGEEIEDRVYGVQDFDRSLVLKKRRELVASKITEFLKATNRFDKTIVFCEDVEHAEAMRSELVNANADLASENRKYVMRITGDNDEGKAELDNFIDPEQRYPVIATTSKLMTTGIDAQTCKLIVLDRTIKSMTEFKQIIGRGTRVNEDYGKFFFTIMDFRKATELFADPAFDGDPVVIYEPKEGEPVVPPDDAAEVQEHEEVVVVPQQHEDWMLPEDDGTGRRRKYVVGDVPVLVVAERVQYYGRDGRLITESLKDYTKKAVRSHFRSLDSFLKRWSEADRKEAVVRELEEQGVLFEALEREVGKDYGPFDLICHVAFDQPPMTRKERAARLKKQNYFTKYAESAQAVLKVLVDKYADEGIEDIESMDILKVQPLTTLGTPVEIVARFGGRTQYVQAIRELQTLLYEAS